MSMDATDSAIALVGTGALGSALCLQLAQDGARNVLLIDPDRVEPRNLEASAFLRDAMERFVPEENEPFKARTLAAAAQQAFHLAWGHQVCEVADVGLGTLARYDVLCCCTDSVISRVETALLARRLRLPMLDCGVFGLGVDEGRVTWFGAAEADACYLCGLSQDRRAQLLTYMTSASLGCVAPPAEAPSMTGSRSTVEQTATCAMRLLSQRVGERPAGSTAYRLRRDSDASAWTEERITLQRSYACPAHEPDVAQRIPLAWEEPLQAVLHASGKQLQLDWPVCTDAVCLQCSQRSAPMRRVGWVRARMPCPSCGQAGCLEPLATLRSVAGDDPFSTCTPRQLGQPMEHLYLLRNAFQPTSTGE